MRKYEGYFNAYEPFINYRTKEEALFEQRCISLDLSEYADEIRCSKSLKQLLEDEHVVRVFDKRHYQIKWLIWFLELRILALGLETFTKRISERPTLSQLLEETDADIKIDYLNEFENIQKYDYIVQKVIKVVHNIKNMELTEFHNQFMKCLESLDNQTFIDIFNKSDDLDNRVNLLIAYVCRKNHIIDINSDLYEMMVDVNFKDTGYCLYILLLAYYFKKYGYIKCPETFDDILTIQFISDYSEGNVTVDTNLIEVLHRKVKKIFFSLYKEYIDEKLPKILKKFLIEKKKSL